MLKNLTFLILFLHVSLFCYSQAEQINAYQINELSWKLDTSIFVKMTNDTSYTVDVRSAFHINESVDKLAEQEFVFYPASLANSYIDDVNNSNPQVKLDDAKLFAADSITDRTLWGALHKSLGGGWIHFTNCIMNTSEVGNLNLESPFLVRSHTYKPKNPSEAYKHTKKWKYYFPVSQKEAIKEYKYRLENNQLGDLKCVPKQYIDLFLKLTDKDIEHLRNTKEKTILAHITLIKVLLGSNYLGESQIRYVKNCILYTIRKYSVPKIPPVIVFDQFKAAVVLSLDKDGYKIDKIAINANERNIEEGIAIRERLIKEYIDKINKYNQESFMKRLSQHYQ